MARAAIISENGRVKAWAACLALFVAGSAWAGPPFVTDDPEPVEYRHWEINSGLAASWGHDEVSAGIPTIDINYGIAPNVQAHIQPRYSYEKAGSQARSGIDDTEIGVKYRFMNIDEGGSAWMAGIYPLYQLPTGDRKLGPGRGEGQAFLPLWIQHDSGPWTVYGGSGYRINPGGGNRNSVFTGVTALYKVGYGLQLGAEVYHESPTASDSGATTAFNVGGSYGLAPRCNLLFSAGRTLNDGPSTPRASAYVAVQLLY